MADKTPEKKSPSSHKVSSDKVTKKRKQRRNRPPPPPITSDFWPSLRKPLQKHPDIFGQYLKIPCFCCRKSISLETTEDDTLCSGALMLPCGHILGEECASEMILRDDWTDRCPKCQTHMIHEGCRHHGHLMPVRKVDDLKRQMRCLFGDNGTLALECYNCALRTDLAELACRFREGLEDWQKDTVRDVLIFKAVNDWESVCYYRAYYRTQPQIYGDRWADVRNWDECFEDEPDTLLPEVITSKVPIGDFFQRMRAQNGWGPRRVDIGVGLPYGRTEGTDDAHAAMWNIRDALNKMPDSSAPHEAVDCENLDTYGICRR